jgi:hypothetical protein
MASACCCWTACSGVSRCFDSVCRIAADCCSSTDLLSQPLAMKFIIGGYGRLLSTTRVFLRNPNQSWKWHPEDDARAISYSSGLSRHERLGKREICGLLFAAPGAHREFAIADLADRENLGDPQPDSLGSPGCIAMVRCPQAGRTPPAGRPLPRTRVKCPARSDAGENAMNTIRRATVRIARAGAWFEPG